MRYIIYLMLGRRRARKAADSGSISAMAWDDDVPILWDEGDGVSWDS